MSLVARPPLVLASGSAYRRELLQRLRLPFAVDVPHVDETALPGERCDDTARRLSQKKAEAVVARHAGAIVIGSDQVAESDGRAYGKPGAHDAAVRQLRTLSGREVAFHTGLCVAYDGRVQTEVITTRVRFRTLDDDAIERYLRLETPYDCAGSAKSEALGIALLERIDSDDPTALVGLPLIALVSMLAAIGFPVLA